MSYSTAFNPILTSEQKTYEPVQQLSTDQTREPSRVYQFGIALFFIMFGFDFKDRGYFESIAILRAIIVSLSLIGFSIAILARDTTGLTSSKNLKINLMYQAWTFYLIYIVFITFVRSPIGYDHIRLAAPYVFMLLSMILMRRHLEAGYTPGSFWKYVLYMGIISTFINLYLGRYASRTYSEDDLFSFIDEVRYTILSSALLPLFAVSFYNLSRFRKILPNLSLLFLLMSLFLISKSRGFLSGILCVALYAILTSPYRNRAGLTVTIATIILIGGVSLLTFEFRNFDILGTWAFRFGLNDQQFVDFTWYTRLAEYKGQFTLLLSDIQSAIFGYGFLKQTYWDPHIFDFLVYHGLRGEIYDTYLIAGHSTWITSLFQGGVIIGAIPFITISYLFVVAFLLPFKRKEIRNNMELWGGISLGIMVALYLPSNFGSFFVDRIFPIIIGAALLQGIYEHHRLKRIEKSWISHKE